VSEVADDELGRLRRRLERERAARAEAEAAAERGLSRLYELQARTQLLRTVAELCQATEAPEEALHQVVRALVDEGGWVAAHADLRAVPACGGGDLWASLDERLHDRLAADTLHLRASDARRRSVGVEAARRRTVVVAGGEPGEGLSPVDDPRLASGLVCTAFGVPVIVDGRVRAVLELFDPRRLRPDAELERLLHELAASVARLLERVEARERLEALVRERGSELAALRENAGRSLALRDRMLDLLEARVRPALAAVAVGVDAAALDAPTVDLDPLRAEVAAASGCFEEIVELFRLEAGRVDFRMGDVDLRALLADVAAEHEGAALEQGTVFRAQVAAAVPRRVRADARVLRGILTAFAGHALARTEFGIVELGAVAVPGGIRFRIDDTGAPVTAAALEAAFEPRREPGPAAEGEFALALARRRIEALGGELELETPREAGLRVAFLLPLATS
jgi:signal transduction histidine kinase